MTIKTTTDGDTVTTETMADRLRAVQSEPWRKMRYTDENEEAAWDVYNDSLFLRSKDAEGAQPQAPAGEGGEVPDQGQDLAELVPQFTAKWDDKKLLEAVSGITRRPNSRPRKRSSQRWKRHLDPG
jgi:DNA-directed RNA polymerase-3 subunit RPC5